MKREMQVAFSRHGQPGWFRVVKWVIMIGVSRRVYGLFSPPLTRHIVGSAVAPGTRTGSCPSAAALTFVTFPRFWYI